MHEGVHRWYRSDLIFGQGGREPDQRADLGEGSAERPLAHDKPGRYAGGWSGHSGGRLRGEHLSAGNRLGHRPAHDFLGSVPTDAQQLARLADAGGGQEHGHGQTVKEQGESSLRFGPRHPHGLGSVLRTTRPRCPCPNECGKLHLVQMPPRPPGSGSPLSTRTPGQRAFLAIVPRTCQRTMKA